MERSEQREIGVSGQRGKSEFPGLLSWMQQAIEARADESYPDVNTHVKPNSRLSSAGRLALYTDSYYSRLADALFADYAGVRHALGDERWYQTANAYARQHPSTHPNLNFYGQHFPEFLRSLDHPHAEFLSELARLEWCVVELFDCHDAEPLAQDALARMNPEDWPRVLLTPRPAVRLLEFTYPVDTYLQGVYDESDPEIPNAKEPHWVQVYRRDFRVWRQSIPEARALLLARIIQGETLGDALDDVAATVDEPNTFVANIQEWFSEWSGDGIFATLRLEE